MDFIALQVHCDGERRDLILAELSLFPFDAFEENEAGLLASCAIGDWNETDVKEVLDRYGVSFEIQEVEKVNWNEEWEKNYDPVIVDDQCIIRATFHKPRPEFPYEIIITPKMSFGTGHHATTYQMLAKQMKLNHSGKRVLDVGCGTAALAIMAWKRGAGEVAAVDIDEWCIENSTENLELNNCPKTILKLGGIAGIEASDQYDIILANINKHVLMEQIKEYAVRLAKDGTLLLSGFYVQDIADLEAEAKKSNLQLVDQSERNQWAMLTFKKGG